MKDLYFRFSFPRYKVQSRHTFNSLKNKVILKLNNSKAIHAAQVCLLAFKILKMKFSIEGPAIVVGPVVKKK